MVGFSGSTWPCHRAEVVSILSAGALLTSGERSVGPGDVRCTGYGDARWPWGCRECWSWCAGPDVGCAGCEDVRSAGPVGAACVCPGLGQRLHITEGQEEDALVFVHRGCLADLRHRGNAGL